MKNEKKKYLVVVALLLLLTFGALALAMFNIESESDYTVIAKEQLIKQSDVSSLAEDIWNTCHKNGLDDISTAVFMGILSVESNMDNMMVEGIYAVEDFDSKEKALEDINAYTESLLDLYEDNGLKVNDVAYKASDGKYYCGIGLLNVSGERAKSLMEYSDNWIDTDVQLQYIFETYSSVFNEITPGELETVTKYMCKSLLGQNDENYLAKVNNNAKAWLDMFGE